MAAPKYLECNSAAITATNLSRVCSNCESQWLEARYDYGAFKREILRGLPNRPSNMWRYQDVLPLNNPASLDLYPAGGTPLWLSQRYAPRLGHSAVYIKDERYGPTSSFKDRQAAGAVAAMLERGVKEAVIASTGNAAVAYAAACARVGIKLWVFMTSLVPQEKLREAALFGAEVIRVSGNYDQTKQIASQFAQRRQLLLDRGATSIPAREAMKTIAYEIVEQLGWHAPDWYIQAVSGGLGPLGSIGLQELFKMGLIVVSQTGDDSGRWTRPWLMPLNGKAVASRDSETSMLSYPQVIPVKPILFVGSHSAMRRRDGSVTDTEASRRCDHWLKAKGWLLNRQQPSPSRDSRS
jgi:threonine synthase